MTLKLLEIFIILVNEDEQIITQYVLPSNSITSHLSHQSSEKVLEILDLYKISCFSKLEFLAPTRKTEPSAMTYDPVA